MTSMAHAAQRHKWQGDDEPDHVRMAEAASQWADSGAEMQREAWT